MKAMVLAAGRGTRQFPLTGVLPKPMAPVADKPVIQHIFELFSRTGVHETHVNVHHPGDAILDHCGRGPRSAAWTCVLNARNASWAQPAASRT